MEDLVTFIKMSDVFGLIFHLVSLSVFLNHMLKLLVYFYFPYFSWRSQVFLFLFSLALLPILPPSSLVIRSSPVYLF